MTATHDGRQPAKVPVQLEGSLVHLLSIHTNLSARQVHACLPELLTTIVAAGAREHAGRPVYPVDAMVDELLHLVRAQSDDLVARDKMYDELVRGTVEREADMRETARRTMDAKTAQSGTMARLAHYTRTVVDSVDLLLAALDAEDEARTACRPMGGISFRPMDTQGDAAKRDAEQRRRDLAGVVRTALPTLRQQFTQAPPDAGGGAEHRA